MSIQELATTFLDFFKTKERGNDEIIVLSDDAPGDLQILVREAHGEMLPDDFRYRFISDALYLISDADDDSLDEPNIDSDVDVYYHDLLRWLSSNLLRLSYIDDAVQELGCDSDFELMNFIPIGQYRERSEVYYSVLSSLRTLIDERDEDET